MQGFVGTGGVFNFSPADHNGLDIDAFAMMIVKDGAGDEVATLEAMRDKPVVFSDV